MWFMTSSKTSQEPKYGDKTTDGYGSKPYGSEEWIIKKLQELYCGSVYAYPYTDTEECNTCDLNIK